MEEEYYLDEYELYRDCSWSYRRVWVEYMPDPDDDLAHEIELTVYLPESYEYGSRYGGDPYTFDPFDTDIGKAEAEEAIEEALTKAVGKWIAYEYEFD